MANSRKISIEQYRYTLPDSKIARYPLPRRDRSKLLLYNRGKISHRLFSELPEVLPAGAWLAFNNTRVIQARLQFRKPTGARIEIFCLEPLEPADYQQSFHSTSGCSWHCLVGNAKKWKSGPVHLTTTIRGEEITLYALKNDEKGDGYSITFHWDDERFSFGEIIEQSGSTPIPPYLKREAEEGDKKRYQTIYSQLDGSVAAPTAGLHFTREMMERMEHAGIRFAGLTLHVGAGTFVPVKSENARKHTMHSEQVVVSRAFIREWIRNLDGLIAVGTTTTRSLESLYWLGVKHLSGGLSGEENPEIIQWENEKLPAGYSLQESLLALLAYCDTYDLDQICFSTRLMIVPGYHFRTISGLITNFHMPGSTLLLLIAAWIGDDWKNVYEYALRNDFRFLSYGDSSLLLPGRAKQ